MSERWYEFEETESFTRPVYVKARSLKEARARRSEAVLDYVPTFPTVSFHGRGRIARDQAYVDALAEEVRGAVESPPAHREAESGE